MSEPRWMQPPYLRQGPGQFLKDDPDQSHLSWPWNLPILNPISDELEVRLHRNLGNGCQMAKYLFEDRKWRFDTATRTLEDIKDMVSLINLPSHPEKAASAFFLVSSLQDEAIRCLGHWMGIPPQFFMLPSVHLRVITGTQGREYLMFSLQYMNKYPVGHNSPESLLHYQFRSKTGQQPHEWHANHARLIFFADPARGNETASPGANSSSSQSHVSDNVHMYWRGLYMFNQGDDSIATSLRDRMVAQDREDPKATEVYQGLGQIVQDVIYLISMIRTEFFDEAMLHLQVLGKKCLDEDLDPGEQLEYMRELYELLPLWSQLRRQLDGTKNLVAQISRHEISSFISGVRDNRYYVKRLSVVEDQLGRCNDAADKTKNLINLIMGIASLQESRAAVRESRAANSFASSIQRVTILTFIYLPLTLASSILGMNVTQISGEAMHSQLWLYFVIAVSLMAATFGGWFVWSQLLSSIEHRIRRRAAMRVAMNKGV